MYRPKNWDMVIGQPHIVKAIRQQLGSPTCPHFFIFVGPAGTGKTSMARLLAKEFGCKQPEELDAGTSGGVDHIKNIVDQMGYRPPKPMGKARVLIMDEIHDIHKQAWKALLKSTEEPPKHAFYIFCTTELGKLPDTIISRAHLFKTVAVEDAEMLAWAQVVSEKEASEGRPINISEQGLQFIIKASGGCVRKMLVFMDQCRGMSYEEIQKIVANPFASEEGAIFDIMKTVLWKPGTSWEQYMALAATITDWTGITLGMQSFISGQVAKKPLDTRTVIIMDSLDKMPNFIANDKVGLFHFQMFLIRLMHNKVL